VGTAGQGLLLPNRLPLRALDGIPKSRIPWTPLCPCASHWRGGPSINFTSVGNELSHPSSIRSGPQRKSASAAVNRGFDPRVPEFLGNEFYQPWGGGHINLPLWSSLNPRSSFSRAESHFIAVNREKRVIAAAESRGHLRRVPWPGARGFAASSWVLAVASLGSGRTLRPPESLTGAISSARANLCMWPDLSSTPLPVRRR
jgi:hypothetical protein